jgi:two-component system, OmpR family, response regulator
VLDPAARTLEDAEGRPVELTGGELDLLLALVQRPQRVLSREQLLDLARGRDAQAFDRSIDVQISRIRRKIEADPARPALIRTVRGGGYMLACQVERG